MKRPSAKCPSCNYVVNLRADGTLGKHHVWIGHEYKGECVGVGQAPAK